MTDSNKTCGPCCPITGCSIRKLLLSTIVAFAVVFGFDSFFHANYMMDDYTATASLWRDEASMKNLFHIILISEFMRAFASAAILCMVFKNYTGNFIVKGAKTGLIIGLISGAYAFGSYAYTPVPMEIPLKWLAADLILGVLIGTVIGVMHAKCQSKKGCE